MKPNNLDLVMVWMANCSSSLRCMLSTITWLLSLQWNLWSQTCFLVIVGTFKTGISESGQP